MGFWRRIFTFQPDAFDTAEHSLEQVLWDLTENVDYSRIADSVAAVYRARTMTADTVASIPFVDALPAPNSRQTWQQFLHESMLSLQDCGDAYWRVRDGNLTVLNPVEMSVTWNPQRTARVYTYRKNERLFDGVNMRVVAINRGASDVTGRAPMESPVIRKLIAADKYIRQFYENNASPSGILNIPRDVTAEQADFARQLWVDQTRTRGPAVLSGGLTWDSDGFSPQDSQWVEGHYAGYGDVALLWGIPGALLLFNTPGSSLTYANVGDLLEQYWRATLFPTYGRRLEDALGEIYATQVRFDPEQYFLASLATRAQATRTLVDAGYEPDDAADVAGMPPMRHTGLPPVQVHVPEESPDV